MIDTLNIFLESNQNEMDREIYNDVMEYLKEELVNKSYKTKLILVLSLFKLIALGNFETSSKNTEDLIILK